MKKDKTIINKINFKNIKYKTKKIIQAEKNKEEIKHFERNEVNDNKIWKKLRINSLKPMKTKWIEYLMIIN